MKTPQKYLFEFEKTAAGVDFGKVSLTVCLRAGKPRYVIKSKKTFAPEGGASASAPDGKHEKRQ